MSSGLLRKGGSPFIDSPRQRTSALRSSGLRRSFGLSFERLTTGRPTSGSNLQLRPADNSSVKAIILAAGRGSRLRPLTDGLPKCLLPIGDGTILGRLLGNLEIAGIGEAVMVCGYRINQVRQAADAYRGGVDIRLVSNPFHSVADNLVSLWAARSHMDGDFLLINGDNVFSPAGLPLLAHTDSPCCLMVRRRDTYDGDDMKVAIRGDGVVRIGKDLSAGETTAASVGIMQFRGRGVDWIRGILEESVMADGAMQSLFPSAIQGIIDQGRHVSYLDIGRLPCADVDTVADLDHVRSQIDRYTRLEAAVAESASPGEPA